MPEKKATTECRLLGVRCGAWIGADPLLLKGADVREFKLVARSIATGHMSRCSIDAGSPTLLLKTLHEPEDAASHIAR